MVNGGTVGWFSLANLLKMAKPLSTAHFVKFTTIQQPETMPSQRNNVMLEWPYVEGLRIDEAMHPLTMLAVGMYGDILPKQNGAPLRLVVPWKYGFKSIKAIVKIELLKYSPLTTWNKAAPTEYGFYANVNPDVSHPRWSQNSERQLGSGFSRRVGKLNYSMVTVSRSPNCIVIWIYGIFSNGYSNKNRKLVTLVVCLIPLLWLFLDIAFGNLGSNPIQALHIRLGDWSLRFLCITLAVTPIQMMTRWRGMSDYRQMLGLYAFLRHTAFACLFSG